MVKKLFAQIALLLLSLLDAMNSLFRFLAGLGSGESDLISTFLKNSSISSAWIYIVVIAIAALAILTVVALIKTMSDPKRQQTKVLGTFFTAILSLFITQIVIFGGIAISNALLKSVDSATSSQYSMTFSQRIMQLCVKESGWRDGYGPQDFNPNALVTEVFGFYKPNIFGFEISPFSYESENGADGVFNIFKNNDTYLGGGIVDLYQTNIFLMIVVSLFLVIIVAFMLLKLTRRIFDVILLYLLMPFSIAAMPLDDGERFRTWRENITGKILSIYGTVIAFNMFNIFGAVLEGLAVAGEHSSANTVLSFLLIIGGIFSAAGASSLFSSIIGVGKTQNTKSLGGHVNGSGHSSTFSQIRDSIKTVTARRQAALTNGTATGAQTAGGSAASSLAKTTSNFSNIAGGVARYAGLKIMSKLNDNSLRRALSGKPSDKLAFESNHSIDTQNKDAAARSLSLPNSSPNILNQTQPTEIKPQNNKVQE